MSMQAVLELWQHRLGQALVRGGLARALTRYRRSKTDPLDPVMANVARVFVDVSVISRHDAGTGIQRVVRALALGLDSQAGATDWDLHFVAAGRDTPYHTISWPGEGGNDPLDVMDGRPGDVFIGLDFSLDDIRWNASQLAQFRRQGGKLWFLVHDLLPLENPDWFSRNTVIRYRAWLDILARLADGFLCNSPQTETQLRRALKRVYGLESGYETRVLPMGYQITEKVKIRGPARGRLDGLLKGASDQYFLQVGTLEPRKGHADVLDAFEVLWANGFPDALVFVGRQGWQVDDLYGRIHTHPLFKDRLFWFDDVEDQELDAIYQGCKGTIIASFAEGFGLPLIEALGHGKPVLARDLEVFRMHESCGTQYFPDTRQCSVLAQKILQWSSDIENGRISISPPVKSWDDAISELMLAIR